MKKIIYLLFIITITTTSLRAQSAPDRQTTINYIQNIFNQANGYECVVAASGNRYRIEGGIQINGSHNWNFGIHITDKYLFYGRTAVTSGICSYGEMYDKIDFAKLTDTPRGDEAYTETSPVRFVILTFLPNLVFKTGYSDSNCNRDPESKYGGVRLPVNLVWIPYRNEPGVKERLIKAIMHLSEIDKAAKPKSDPFGN